MTFKSLATKLVLVFSILVLCACGKSPWADYVKENTNRPSGPPDSLGKVVGDCPLLNSDQIRWLQGPLVKKESVFEMTFLQSPDFPVGAEIFMPSMGHGSVPVKIASEDGIHFVVRNVFFLMHGPWIIRIKNRAEILCTYQIEIAP